MAQNDTLFLDTSTLPRHVTRFWLIRHGIVEARARDRLYGALDIPLCPESLCAQRSIYAALGQRLPGDAVWITSPLARAHGTAQAIFDAGYGQRDVHIEPRFIEQSMGEWHNLPHHEVPSRLTLPPHAFWSLPASEKPPGGESMLDVCARVGHALDELVRTNHTRDTVIVSHGGAIRAALAHALRVHPETALHFSIQNLSVTILEYINESWRIVSVNDLPH